MGIYRPLKIAIVYDWIDKWGGVERVLLTLAEMFPRAHFYTSYYDLQNASWAKDLNITTSFIQKLPNFIKTSRIFSFALYPIAFESFNFSRYDLVISATSSFAKGIITKPETMHICYLLTPTRYLWSHYSVYLKNKLQRFVAKKYRKWDYVAAQRPDKIIALSKTVQKRTRKYYDRDSEIIYPPFDTDYWKKISLNTKHQTLNIPNEKFYLVVSRLEPYKRVYIAIEAFRKRQEQLIVVGSGTQEKKLKQLASDNVLFLNNLTDGQLATLYQKAEALIMPQEEDFGYVALEAQYFGCPVVAFKKGGASETIIENKTGIFFETQTADSLSAALERYQKISYNLKELTAKYGPKNADHFSKEKFEKKFLSQI